MVLYLNPPKLSPLVFSSRLQLYAILPSVTSFPSRCLPQLCCHLLSLPHFSNPHMPLSACHPVYAASGASSVKGTKPIGSRRSTYVARRPMFTSNAADGCCSAYRICLTIPTSQRLYLQISLSSQVSMRRGLTTMTSYTSTWTSIRV